MLRYRYCTPCLVTSLHWELKLSRLLFPPSYQLLSVYATIVVMQFPFQEIWTLCNGTKHVGKCQSLNDELILSAVFFTNANICDMVDMIICNHFTVQTSKLQTASKNHHQNNFRYLEVLKFFYLHTAALHWTILPNLIQKYSLNLNYKNWVKTIEKLEAHTDRYQIHPKIRN